MAGKMYPVQEFYLEDILLRLNGQSNSAKVKQEAPTVWIHELDGLIEQAFRYGDCFENLYQLFMEENYPVDYKVKIN